jgi:DNA-binding response OmpR family regulator
LAGLRVLAVEDEAVLAMALEDTLVELGCVVLGPVGSVAKALALIESESLAIGAGVLDIRLGVELAYPIADELAKRSVPFMFLSGYGSAGPKAPHENVPILAKPYDQRCLGRMLEELRRGSPRWPATARQGARISN